MVQILSNWNDGSYAFLLIQEPYVMSEVISEWAIKQYADTLRVLIDERGIAIGNGHGNTHGTMISKIRTIPGFKRWFPKDYIFYVENKCLMVNETSNGDNRMYVSKFIEDWEPEHGNFLKEIAKFALAKL